jgi:hypothetical protein
MKLNSLLLFVLASMCSCQRHVSKYERTTEYNLTEVFLYPKDNKTNVPLETAIKEEIDKGFQLAPIKNSNKKAEIRIYFVGAFNSRFLRQIFQDDSVLVELNQCRVVERNDSILMKLGTKITAKGKAAPNILRASTELPVFYQNAVEGVLDGSSCLIQIQYQHLTKTLSIDLPFPPNEQDPDKQKITNFLNIICQKYSFRFNGSWDNTDSLAFKPNNASQ